MEEFIKIMSNIEFKPFDKVLVRNDDSFKWKIDIFERFDISTPYSFICIKNSWKQCILYKGNELLLGTTNTPKSIYEFKKGDSVIVWDNDNPDRRYIRVFNSKSTFNDYYTYNRVNKTTTRWNNCIPFKFEDL